MMKVEITIDDSISGGIRRIIEAELGQVPIQITGVDQQAYEIEIDADPTTAQQISMRDNIISFLEGLGKYPTFEVKT